MSGETYLNKYNERPWVLVRLADGMTMPMGSFYVPPAYRGTYWRCDLHARYRPDDRMFGTHCRVGNAPSVGSEMRQVLWKKFANCHGRVVYRVMKGVRTLKKLSSAIDAKRMSKPMFCMIVTAQGDFAYEIPDVGVSSGRKDSVCHSPAPQRHV